MTLLVLLWFFFKKKSLLSGANLDIFPPPLIALAQELESLFLAPRRAMMDSECSVFTPKLRQQVALVFIA